MEVEVTVLTRRGSAMMRRSRRINARRLRFGRGTGNEVPLPDIRVDLSAAALFPFGGRLSIRALGPSPLRVNGQSTSSASVGPGDEILIGPYRIELTEPPAGCDAALSIELVQPLGDALDRLMSQARVGLQHAVFSKRAIAWIGFLLIVAVCLIAPIVIYAAGLIPTWLAAGDAGFAASRVAFLWQPGEQSNAHRFFAANCTTCHRSPFARVSDQVCLGCHTRPPTDLAGLARAGSVRHTLETMRCTDCHEEHRGRHGTVVAEARLCVACHGTIEKTAPSAGIKNVGGFPGDHPQFRVTLVGDPVGPKLSRVELGGNSAPTDRPGLKFSHAAHLVTGGFPALGYQPMACGDCHVAAPGGESFLPITYKQQCERCHALKFERQDLPWPNGTVQHGDDASVVATVWNYYAGKALQGGMLDAPAAAVARRAPGAPGAAGAEEATPAAWVASKTEAALRTIVLDPKRGCGYCHFGTGPKGEFDLSHLLPAAGSQPPQAPGRIIAPVVLQTRFLPHARFDHAQHAAMDCAGCHDARHAETSAAVMIPGIANCAQCHGAERTASRTESTCTTCHRFHHELLGPRETTRTAVD